MKSHCRLTLNEWFILFFVLLFAMDASLNGFAAYRRKLIFQHQQASAARRTVSSPVASESYVEVTKNVFDKLSGYTRTGTINAVDSSLRIPGNSPEYFYSFLPTIPAQQQQNKAAYLLALKYCSQVKVGYFGALPTSSSAPRASSIAHVAFCSIDLRSDKTVAFKLYPDKIYYYTGVQIFVTSVIPPIVRGQ